MTLKLKLFIAMAAHTISPTYITGLLTIIFLAINVILKHLLYKNMIKQQILGIV
jgi:hypothetical protein